MNTLQRGNSEVAFSKIAYYIYSMEFLRKKPNLTALFLCGAGVAVNLILNSAAKVFEIPLYLDTVGTIAVAIMGGYLPGVMVAFVTNTVKAVLEPLSLYYGVISVLIAVFAAFISNRYRQRRIRGLILMIAVFSLTGGILGSLIPMFIKDLSFDGEALSLIIHDTGLFSPGISSLLSGLILDLPDKAISVLMAASIVHFIPESFYRNFKFSMWMQNPDAGDKDIKKTTEVRIVSLRVKILIVMIVSLTVVAVVCSLLSVQVYKRMTIDEHSQLAVGTAKLASRVINGNRVEEYLKSGGESKDYYLTRNSLENILLSSPEIAFLYVYKIEPEGFRVVFDFDTEKIPADPIGSLIPFYESFIPYIPELLAGENVEPIISNDQYGFLLTAAVPVYDSAGRCVCYAIADVDLKKLEMDGRSFLAEMITVFLGFFILLCVFSIWLVNYHLILPINSIVRCMDEFSHSSNTQKQMDEDVKMFRQLGIHTGDELENLFIAAGRLTKNQAEQMRSIRRLSDSTAKMQDGLIITMADLVESRDSDTGAHVQKTSAYVKIIAEGLQKKGYYLTKLTPKFISDIVRSAPLHDIGKINIPDEVLNKPGKLDPEEYEIMKTHTTAGKRIIENAISTVKGDNYLKEARNMAAYHHEKWDGTGYPEGIHGEVIPLSARIMAVADVFDALTSQRVYKKAFPLEKALAILEEGKGTQFDPKCIEVFMEALPEVKVILHKYNQG